MDKTSFDYESLKIIFRDFCLDNGFMQDDQEVADILVKFRRMEWPKDQDDVEDKKFEVRIDGIRLKFKPRTP